MHKSLGNGEGTPPQHFHCSGGGPRSLRSFSGGFRGRANHPGPFPTLSPSLIGHPASVDVKQHKSQKRKVPSHNDGWVTPHYTISLTATAEAHPNTVMSAPLRHPSVASTEHIDTLSAGGPSSPATWTSVYIRAHSPPFLQHTASQHRPAPPSHQLLLGGGGGCSGDTCVTQACSVYPAVCFNGSLFLYTPDRCVLVA